MDEEFLARFNALAESAELSLKDTYYEYYQLGKQQGEVALLVEAKCREDAVRFLSELRDDYASLKRYAESTKREAPVATIYEKVVNDLSGVIAQLSSWALKKKG